MPHIPTAEQINNALPTIAKVAALGTSALALGTCSNNGLAEILVGHLHQSSITPEETENLLNFYGNLGGIGASLAGNFLGEHLSKVGEKLSYGIKDDLETSLQTAVGKAIPQLRTELLDYYGDELDQPSRAAFENLFTRLAKMRAKDMEFDEQEINSLALHRNEFFQELFAEPYNDWNEVYFKPDTFPENFELAIAIGFAILVRNHLHELLKDNDNQRARTAYFIYLLEFNAQRSQGNAEQLEKALTALDALKDLPEVLTNLSRDMVHAHTLIVELLTSLNRNLKEAKLEILDEIHSGRQPDLYLPERSTSKDYDYHYKAQYTTFVGREEELEQLRQFALTDPDRRFCWWMLTGAGGSGKSRTAFELCYQLRSWDFYAGFLEKHSLDNIALWAQWKPRFPTLIVIDYATLYLAQVTDLLKVLHHKQSTYDYPVRVLMLERDIRDDWWQRLTQSIEAKQSSYRGNPSPESSHMLQLPSLGDFRWAIISEIFRRKHKPLPSDRVEILEMLHVIDFQDRPLFAFFAGMALVEGENIRGWDMNTLLGNLMRREKELWQLPEGSMADKHLNLLTLATLTRGITSSQLIKIQEKKYDWLPLSRIERVDQALYSRMSTLGVMGENPTYKGLEPDLFGEYFVLHHLNQILEEDIEYGQETATQILQTAWDTKSEDMQMMTFLTLIDSGQSSPAYQLLMSTPPSDESPDKVWGDWGGLWVNATSIFGEAESRRAYDLFCSLAANHLHISILQLRKAEALTNLAIKLSGSLIQMEAHKLLNEFDDLDSSKYSEIFHEKAKAIFNISHQYIRRGLTAEVWKLFIEFDKLKPANNLLIAIEKAKLITNFAGNLDDQATMEEKRKLLAEFDELKPEEQTQIALLKAMALLNLIADLNGSNIMEEGWNLLAEYESLNPQQYAEIKIQKAMALANFSLKLCGPEMAKEAQRIIDEFDSFDLDEHSLAALYKAQTLANLSHQLSGKGLKEESWQMITRFDTLTSFQSLEITLQKAQALTDLATKVDGPDMYDEAQKILEEFDTLTPTNHPEINLEKSRAIYNLLIQFSQEDNMVQVWELLSTFDSLNPTLYPKIALEKERAITNLSIELDALDLIDISRKLLSNSTSLDPVQYPDIALQKSKTISNLCKRFYTEGLYREAISLLNEFDALAPLHNVEIAKIKAKTLTGIIVKIHTDPLYQSKLTELLSMLSELADHYSVSSITEELHLSQTFVSSLPALLRAEAILNLMHTNLTRLDDEDKARQASEIIHHCLEVMEELTEDESTREELWPQYAECIVMNPFVDSSEMALAKAGIIEWFFGENLGKSEYPEANREQKIKNFILCYQAIDDLFKRFPELPSVVETHERISEVMRQLFSRFE